MTSLRFGSPTEGARQDCFVTGDGSKAAKLNPSDATQARVQELRRGDRTGQRNRRRKPGPDRTTGKTSGKSARERWICPSHAHHGSEPPVTPRPFRQHDQVLVHVPSPIYRQLVREWVALNAHTSSDTTVRRWGRLEPALAGHSRPCDIVDAIDDAAPTQTERVAGCADPAIAGRPAARRPGRPAGDAAETACGSRCEPQRRPPTTRGSRTATTSLSLSSGTSWPPTPCTGDPTRSPATSPSTPCTASAAFDAPEPDIPLDPTELSDLDPQPLPHHRRPGPNDRAQPGRRPSPGHHLGHHPTGHHPQRRRRPRRRPTYRGSGRPGSRTPRKPGASPKRRCGNGAAAPGADSPTRYKLSSELVALPRPPSRRSQSGGGAAAGGRRASRDVDRRCSRSGVVVGGTGPHVPEPNLNLGSRSRRW